MKSFAVICSLFAMMLVIGCADDDNGDNGIVDNEVAKTVTVTIMNESGDLKYIGSGSFGAGLVEPGDSMSITFRAPEGSRLSFATMFVQSNDWFFAPDDQGMPLYDGATPLEGDITDSLKLWDAGTEFDQPIGTGDAQAPRQSGPNTGANDDVQAVRLVTETEYQPDSVLTATITPMDDDQFKLTIKTLGNSPTPLSPGVWVVHTEGMPIFEGAAPDMGKGLESLAEDGMPGELAASLDSATGVSTPLSPGVWAVGDSVGILFETGSSASAALEKLAEDGDPSALDSVFNVAGLSSETFGNGLIQPGSSVSFSATISPGQRLFFATMLVESNDAFFASGEDGIVLLPSGGSLTTGDITNMVEFWDAGTEVNQIPGFGDYQALRQAGPDTGVDEGGTVEEITISDPFTYGSVDQLISVTVSEE